MGKRLARDATSIVMLLTAIGFTVSLMRPVYARKTPGVGEVIRSVEAPSEQEAEPLTGSALADSIARIEASPEFAEQKARFAADLVRTGRMKPERADSIARFAVREAFLRGVPPAVIFGILLTENAQFISRARSNVGAVGLMQVYPRVWEKALERKFGSGTDIAADSTNIRYGVFILANYLRPKGIGDRHVVTTEPGSLMKGLLRYNGCVRGTNTPRCHTYPSKVAQYVQRDAQALCGGQDFYRCIAKPFMDGLLGRAND